MPLTALPLHLQDIENSFPDDEQFGTKTLFGKLYRWVNKKTKTWFAFSYRCGGWLKWRKYPIILFAIGGEGQWRYEGTEGEYYFTRLERPREGYLSRIQYYKRWHFAIQWPLLISFHFYPKAADVPTPNEHRPDLDGKVWFAYWGHFDHDLVYWMLTSVYIGRNWK